jgi:hypothetical protein
MWGFNHIRLLTSVDVDAWSGAGFNGPLFPSGAAVPIEKLGPRPVLVECAGPQGEWRRTGQRQREWLWILWRYDWDAREWREVARALAYDWSWALVLRDPAIRELAAETPAVDPVERGGKVTDELWRMIDSALSTEPPSVRDVVFTSIYDRMAGRIVKGMNGRREIAHVTFPEIEDAPVPRIEPGNQSGEISAEMKRRA